MADGQKQPLASPRPGGGSVRDALRATWQRLRGGELTPSRAALSVAIGLAIGVTPVWGFHFWLVLAVCVPLRLDAPVAYLAANISMPLIAPFLTLAEIEIGARVRTGAWIALTADAVRAHGTSSFLGEIVIGTAIFAPTMALVGGSLTYAMLRVLRPSVDPMDVLFRDVAERYARGSKFTRGYVKSKMASDPVVREVTSLGKRESLGNVLDVGCGRGQLAIALVLGNAAERVIGFDHDAAKVDDAIAAASGLQASFERADVCEVKLPPCDTVLMIDVLHYLTTDEQDALVERAADAARTRVIVRELDPDRGWRSRVTKLQERITTSLGVNRGARVEPRPISAIAMILEKKGYSVTITPCWGSTPFSNVLLAATKTAATKTS